MPTKIGPNGRLLKRLGGFVSPIADDGSIITFMPASASSPARRLHVALIGTRGVPAAYGGFETAVEEVGRRLVSRGHRVSVYGRNESRIGNVYLGMRRVTLPAIRKKALETPSHTALSVVHAISRRSPDVAIVFNAANSPFIPALRLRGIPTALHVDGLEWKRSKWGGAGRHYYRLAESFGVRTSDALIADSPGISDYYRHQFGATTELIAYGAPHIEAMDSARVAELTLTPGDYHLVVARFEPENHVLEIVEGYHDSAASKPLVVVGSAPYSEEYTTKIQAIADNDSRIRLLGAIYDQEQLDSLYYHACSYIHGHSVGGTNPSLLRAIGAGTAVVAYDVSFNKHVLNGHGWFFSDSKDVAKCIQAVEESASKVAEVGAQLQQHARDNYTWDDVTDEYEALALRLADGYSHRSSHRRARRKRVEWTG